MSSNEETKDMSSESNQKSLKTNVLKNLSTNDSKRDSFETRICDDLSQYILQFLSFKDKLNFECVSKQFQRSVFSRLHLDLENMSSILALKAMLKKCPNVRSIDLLECWDIDVNEAMDVILNNCHHLDAICFDSDIDFVKIKALFEKFGSNIRELKIYDTSRRQMSSNYWTIPPLSENAFNKLKRLSLHEWRNDLSCIDTRRLTHIDISLTNRMDSSESIEQVLNYLSKFENLVHFDLQNISLTNGTIPEPIVTKFNQIAVNCPNVKSIGLKLREDFPNQLNAGFRRDLSPLKCFKQLKRLSLSLAIYNKPLILSKIFTGFECLTHLSLHVTILSFPNPILKGINAKDLISIELYLPNLQVLDFRNSFRDKQLLSYVLRHLSKLRVIKLDSFEENLKNDLMKICPKLKFVKKQLYSSF